MVLEETVKDMSSPAGARAREWVGTWEGEGEDEGEGRGEGEGEPEGRGEGEGEGRGPRGGLCHSAARSHGCPYQPIP